MEIRIPVVTRADGTRTQGPSVSLVKYLPEPDGGKAKQRMVGSVPKAASELPPEIAGKLTKEEQAQFAEWVAHRDRQWHAATQQWAARNLVALLAWGAEGVRAGTFPEHSSLLRPALDDLQGALSGHLAATHESLSAAQVVRQLKDLLGKTSEFPSLDHLWLTTPGKAGKLAKRRGDF